MLIIVVLTFFSKLVDANFRFVNSVEFSQK